MLNTDETALFFKYLLDKMFTFKEIKKRFLKKNATVGTFLPKG